MCMLRGVGVWYEINRDLNDVMRKVAPVSGTRYTVGF